MSIPLLIDIHKVRNLWKNNNHMLLANYLKCTFTLQRDKNGAPLSFTFSRDTIEILLDIAKITIVNEEQIGDIKNLNRELFRSLRNYVINPAVQNYLVNYVDFFKDIHNFMEKLLTSQSYDILQVVLQFLINMVISNKIISCKFFDLFLQHIFSCLKTKVLIYETSALLYNISLYKPLNDLDLDMYLCILQLLEHNNVEFLQFLLESFINYEKFWDCYNNLSLTQRLILLDIIRDRQIKGNNLNFPDKAIKLITQQFITSQKVIFQTAVSKEYNLEPFEVKQLLEVISSLSSNEHCLKMMQDDKDLLITCGILLINIHKLGKESNSYFSALQQLSEIREPSEVIYQHPAFGFKCGLIRIIGNLCWKNKRIQNLVREAELIPVIMDCCNMDARNPFIIQWSIFTIRNLCENNLENQKIIASMHHQGTVSSTDLEKLGFTLHSCGDNSLKIIPLKGMKNTITK